jgi:hypothetical protein
VNEASFIQAIETASQPNYLGDLGTIDGLLRNLALNAIARRTRGSEVYVVDLQADEADRAETAFLARILLGGHGDYAPQPQWNRAGGLDQYLADEFSLDETEPEARVQSVLLAFLETAQTIVQENGEAFVSPQACASALNVLIELYRNALLGIELPQGNL